jgi:hypothetical protein
MKGPVASVKESDLIAITTDTPTACTKSERLSAMLAKRGVQSPQAMRLAGLG